MFLDEGSSQKKSKSYFDNYEYDTLLGIAFRSAFTKCLYNRTQTDIIFGDNCAPSACFYTCTDNDYDNATYHSWGWEAEKNQNASTGIYIDNLCDKVEYLFDIEPDIRKPLHNAKDRLYKRAIIQYLKELNDDMISEIGTSSNIRYSMTYPSDWTPEKVNYLRFLVQSAEIVDKDDHPDRLVMCSEGELIIHLLQMTNQWFSINIKQGYNYLICDWIDAHLKMALYDIHVENNIKVGQYCSWDINYMKESCRLPIGIQDLIERCEKYLLPKLFNPSIALAIQGVEQQNEPVLELRREYKNFIGRLVTQFMKNLSRVTVTRNEPITYTLPLSLQPHVPPSASPGLNLSGSNFLFTDTDEVDNQSLTRKACVSAITIYPSELMEKIFEPVFKKIVKYFDNILHSLGSSVESMILVGELFSSVYVTEMIEEICRRAGTKCINPFQPHEDHVEIFDAALNGTTLIIDSMKVYDCVPEITLDEKSDSISSKVEDVQEVFIFIDYSSIDTKISYILDQPNKVSDTSNIKSITDWPGQVCSDKSFPTVGVMLIPSAIHEFNNNSNGNSGERIVSLKEDDDLNDHFLNYTTLGNEREYEYYTFKKCKRDIIQYIHCREIAKSKSTRIHNDVGELKIAQSISNSCMNEKKFGSTALLESTSSTCSFSNDDTVLPYSSTVTQKRISFKEFSMMYFEYLTSFLYSYFYAKIGARNVRFQFCITRDSHSESASFRLSDDDIYSIATKCGIISREAQPGDKKLLVLERAEATAIYCRELISSSYINSRKEDTGFIQLQLTTDRCLLLLNRIPFFDENKNDTQSGQSWKGIYKHAISKSIVFNFMNAICQNLWIYVQNQQRDLVKRCGRHSVSRRFFSLNNMRTFNKSLHDFFSMVSLDIMDNEKVHEICICKSGQENYCCMFIVNRDLVQYGLIPAINNLVSKIQSNISKYEFHQNLHISNMFLIGELLYCRSQQDYEILEDLLLMRLRNMNFTCSKNLTINHKLEKPQVIKVEGRYRNADDEFSDGMDQSSLVDITSEGSFIYCIINPENRLLERFASRTYATRIEIEVSQDKILNRFKDDPSSFASINYENSNLVANAESTDTKDRISIQQLNGHEELVKSRDEPISNYTVAYVICSKLEAHVKVLNDMSIPFVKKGTLLSSLAPREGEIETLFTIFNGSENQYSVLSLYFLEEEDAAKLPFISPKDQNVLAVFFIPYAHPSYPIVFKSHLSQSGSYDFWVEYDDYIDSWSFQERVLLKDSYPTQFKI